MSIILNQSNQTDRSLATSTERQNIQIGDLNIPISSLGTWTDSFNNWPEYVDQDGSVSNLINRFDI